MSYTSRGWYATSSYRRLYMINKTAIVPLSKKLGKVNDGKVCPCQRSTVELLR